MRGSDNGGFFFSFQQCIFLSVRLIHKLFYLRIWHMSIRRSLLLEPDFRYDAKGVIISRET
jgi:hypothetical protein